MAEVKVKKDDVKTVLVADDDRSIRTVLTQALKRAGYAVRATDNAESLWQWAEQGEGDLVITDVVMPGGSGLDLVPRLREARPEMKVIVVSARNTLMTAVKAAERGAMEYLSKPFDLDELIDLVDTALKTPEVSSEQDNMSDDEELLSNVEAQAPLIGRSQAMQKLYRTIARLMHSDLTVMVTGESGSGKEVAARALHMFSRRSDAPFVAVNMAAIPRDLIESELFGHEKGAFTGAHTRKPGKFEQAGGGTLFLDEIGDMPPEAQTRLLRVLQEGRFTTVGGRTPIRADLRIIAATHRDLPKLIEDGSFREDLYYRLNVVPLHVPPLRDRTEDIPAFIRHFLAESGQSDRKFSDAALGVLGAHDWPGNVRELKNLVSRICALYPQMVIDADAVESEIGSHAPAPRKGGDADTAREEPEDRSLSALVERHIACYFDAHCGEMPPAGLYSRVLQEVERPLIELTLELTNGNQIKAAELLGINRNTLRKKIRELGVEIVRR